MRRPPEDHPSIEDVTAEFEAAFTRRKPFYGDSGISGYDAADDRPNGEPAAEDADAALAAGVERFMKRGSHG